LLASGFPAWKLVIPVTEIEDAPGSARAIVNVPQTGLIHLFNKRSPNKTYARGSWAVVIEKSQLFRSKKFRLYDSDKKEAENVVSLLEA
jgi:hypothetical protein